MTNDSTKAALEHDLSPKSESTFALQYFKTHGLAIAIRLLLCLGNVEWHDQFQEKGPDDWPAEDKAKTPFGRLPVLHEQSQANAARSLAETSAIERYLSRQFGFMGEDAWEEGQINAWVSLVEEAGNSWLYTIVFEKDPETRNKNTTEWIQGAFSRLVDLAEKQLQKNGQCGHLVGTKTSHADVILAAWLTVWLAMDTARVVNARTTPGLLLLKRKIDSHPKVAAYRETETNKELDQGSQDYFGALMDFDIRRLEFF